MSRKLLTIDDLYNYYSSKMQNVHFSSKTDNEELAVQVNGTMDFEQYDDSEGLIPVTLYACHDGKNSNNLYISEEVLEKALPSFSNRPILGYIRKMKDGEYQFAGHEMHIDQDGELIHDEVPVGIINESSERSIQKDEETGKSFVKISGLLFDEYSHAAKIIEKKTECPVSVELTIRELSYNSKEQILEINDFYFSGVTILGKRDNGAIINPAMEGSNIRLTDFSKMNNSVFSKEDDMLIILNELKEKIESFDFAINKNSKEGGNQTMKIDELLEKYGKTIDDIDFDYEDLSDEELEQKFAEAFGKPSSDEDEEDNNESDVKDKFSKVFEIAHEDIRNSLYHLLYKVEVMDECSYYIDAVYDDYFIYSQYGTLNVYRQRYVKNEDDTIAFDGERIHLNVEYITDEELEALNTMRTTFEDTVKELAKYKDEPTKMEILNSADYSLVAGSEEFKALQKQENHFNMSVEEMTAKADSILLEASKHQTFSVKDSDGKIGAKTLPNTKKRVRNYGTLFDEI